MKPILFNTKMVQAIMRGDKTVTRRVVKPQLPVKIYPLMDESFRCTGYFGIKDGYKIKPPYRPGDILYVRETWATVDRYSPNFGDWWSEYIYRASYSPDPILDVPPVTWRPSIHMPREAARIFLRVTDVRVERLDAIDGQGLIDEGLFSLDELRYGLMREKFAAFENLWNSTIKAADRTLYGWDANPWVWVVEFERISNEEVIRDD